MSLSYSNPSDPLATDEGKFLIVAAAITHALILLDGFIGPVRFTSPAINYLVFCAGLLCSWALVVAVFHLPVGMPIRLLASVIPIVWAAACTLLSLLVAFGALFMLSGNSFQQIHVHDLNGRHLVAYRTNGGAMTSYGIIVRQELRIVPGLMLTRPVYSVYPAYDVKIAQVGERSFRFESAPYGDRRPHADVKVVALSRIPWRGGWLAE